MKEIFLLMLSAILIENYIFKQFLGICPFMGVSTKPSTALGMGCAVVFVMTISGAATYAVYHLILVPLGLEYLRTIVFILIIASLVQLVEMTLKKYMPPLYKSLGVFLPLITTNCAVLGVALNVVKKYNGRIMDGMAYSLGTSIGFCIAIILLASIREKLEDNDIPESFKGKPIVLVMACLMAIAFTGFSNLNLG